MAAVERAAGRLDGLRVLDAGCGTGRFTAALERRTAWLAGVDLDPAMLTVAARRVRAPLLAADARSPRRRQLRRPPWQAARFLTRRQLRVLGARHGQVKLHGTLVMPGVVPGSRHAGCLLEAIGRRAFPATGAFQVLTIEKAA